MTKASISVAEAFEKISHRQKDMKNMVSILRSIDGLEKEMPFSESDKDYESPFRLPYSSDPKIFTEKWK